jgi:imidazolonepropionase-like amidohydrolase
MRRARVISMCRCGGVRAAGVVAMLLALGVGPAAAQVVVYGETVYPVTGPPIRDGVVVVQDGRIAAIGPASEIEVPEGLGELRAKVVTPGLIDARATVGLTGLLNQRQDQDQLERSAPIQPQLRALDAFNIHDPLIEWVRSFGVTTIHTGHAPGELISGQTMVIKTWGNTVDEAVLRPSAMVAATLGEDARKEGDKSPGTRAKMMAMLRESFHEAQAYAVRLESPDEEKRPGRNLKLDVLLRVLDRELPLLVSAHRAQDIANALRLAREFGIRVILDGGAESYLLAEEIAAAGVPVIVHPLQSRSAGEMKNASWETPARLKEAGIPIALQSGYESYVPKTRVLLFEAAIAVANGLSFENALAAATIDAARLLGVDDRVGSLEVGKDGDLALYDGDPFEYTTHCVGVVINGEVVREVRR